MHDPESIVAIVIAALVLIALLARRPPERERRRDAATRGARDPPRGRGRPRSRPIAHAPRPTSAPPARAARRRRARAGARPRPAARTPRDRHLRGQPRSIRTWTSGERPSARPRARRAALAHGERTSARASDERRLARRRRVRDEERCEPRTRDESPPPSSSRARRSGGPARRPSRRPASARRRGGSAAATRARSAPSATRTAGSPAPPTTAQVLQRELVHAPVGAAAADGARVVLRLAPGDAAQLLPAPGGTPRRTLSLKATARRAGRAQPALPATLHPVDRQRRSSRLGRRAAYRPSSAAAPRRQQVATHGQPVAPQPLAPRQVADAP